MSKRFIVECDLIDYRRSLLDSLEQGCYIFLTHAIVPKVTEYISSYNEVLILCRRRVKDLFLGDSVCSYDFFDGLPREFNKLANRLPEFTSLTSITIRNNMDKIIDNYPLLTELELTLVSRTLEEWVSHGYGNDADNYNNAIDLSKITPRPKIDTFLGTLVFHSDKSLKYFMHKFPKLKKLKLNYSDVYDLSTTLVETKLSVEIMIQFFKYLFTTPNCTVDHIYIENALQFIATLLHRLSKDDYKIEEFQIKYTTELFGNVADIWRNKGPRFQFSKMGINTPAILTFIYEKADIAAVDALTHFAHNDLIERAGDKFHKLHLLDIDRGSEIGRIFDNTLHDG